MKTFKGKRGIVNVDYYRGKKIAVKTKNPLSEAMNRIENEANFLRLLNKHKIGPRFVYLKDGRLAMEFIDGELFQDYVKVNDKKKIMKVIMEVFNQLRIMDRLGINKEEMHHPVKHIIVRKDKPYLIDFERCRYTEKPKNVTQFVQYLTRGLRKELEARGIMISDEIDKLIKDYKKDINDKNFKKIIGCFG